MENIEQPTLNVEYPVNERIVRPHPCPLPQERGKHLAAVEKPAPIDWRLRQMNEDLNKR
jgi:hypothetical protein